MRRPRPTSAPINPGVRIGGLPSESNHYLECQTCGRMIDMRDLAEVLQHEGPHQPPNLS